MTIFNRSLLVFSFVLFLPLLQPEGLHAQEIDLAADASVLKGEANLRGKDLRNANLSGADLEAAKALALHTEYTARIDQAQTGTL